MWVLGRWNYECGVARMVRAAGRKRCDISRRAKFQRVWGRGMGGAGSSNASSSDGSSTSSNRTSSNGGGRNRRGVRIRSNRVMMGCCCCCCGGGGRVLGLAPTRAPADHGWGRTRGLDVDEQRRERRCQSKESARSRSERAGWRHAHVNAGRRVLQQVAGSSRGAGGGGDGGGGSGGDGGDGGGRDQARWQWLPGGRRGAAEERCCGRDADAGREGGARSLLEHHAVTSGQRV